MYKAQQNATSSEPIWKVSILALGVNCLHGRRETAIRGAGLRPFSFSRWVLSKLQVHEMGPSTDEPIARRPMGPWIYGSMAEVYFIKKTQEEEQ